MIHGANWREHEGRSPLQQWQLQLHHRGFWLSKVLSTRRLSSAAGQSVTSPQPWPGIQMYADCAMTGGTAAALFLKQKVCELSIQPHTAVSLHPIEHYRKWMGAQTHDCSHWLMMHQFNSIFFSFSLLELLCPTSEEWAATLHNCEDIFRQIMFCCNLEDKHGQRGWNHTSLSPPLWHHWISCTLAPFINVHLMENKGNYKLHPVF